MADEKPEEASALTKCLSPFKAAYAKFMGLHSVIKILLAAFIGVGIGIALSASGADSKWGLWLGMPGTLYLRALKLLVVPLVFTSVVTGIASLQHLGLSTGTLGKRTVYLYVFTTLVAVGEGIAVTFMLMPIWNSGSASRNSGVVIKPTTIMFDYGSLVNITNKDANLTYYDASTVTGVRLQYKGAPAPVTVTQGLLFLYPKTVTFTAPYAIGPKGPYVGAVEKLEVLGTPTSLIGGKVVTSDLNAKTLYPQDMEVLLDPEASGSVDTSVLFSAAAGALTVLDPVADSGTELSNAFVRLMYAIVPDNLVGIFYGGAGTPNLLSLIVFAVFFSVALIVIKVDNDNAINVLTPFFQEALDATLWIVVDTTPVAVASLVLSALSAQSLAELGTAMSSLGVLVVGLLAALMFHMFVSLQLLCFYMTRTWAFTHLKNMTRAATISFGSASSAVTLPISIECCEEMGYTPSLVRFCLSLGATISMDGGAIYIPSVIIWLAAQVDIALSVNNIIVLVIISVLSSAGASPTPGIVPIMIMAWSSIFPGHEMPMQIAYIAAIDFFMDRTTTTVNCMGDSIVVRIIDHYVKRLEEDGELSNLTPPNSVAPEQETLAELRDRTSAMDNLDEGSTIRAERSKEPKKTA